MRRFLFEEKDFQYNPYYKRRFNKQERGRGASVTLSKLLQSLGPRPSSGGNRAGKLNTGGNHDYRQKCVVKMQYSNSMKAHRDQIDAYLDREGTAVDGGRAELYGTDPGEYRDNMVERNFRIFLSPQSDRVDLKDMTERFMQTLERQTGYKFYWQAANHYNTAHPHSHVLINGVDKDGKIIDIPRDIVKTFMREYARDICTSQIGNRSRAEIDYEKSKEPELARYTRLDNSIKDLCNGGTTVNPHNIRFNRDKILSRFNNLCKMGLCNYFKGSYHLDSNWEENLRANTRYNTFLTARSQLKYTDQANLAVYSGKQGIISGKVTKIFTPGDDTSNNYAVLVEGLDGMAYFVPLLRKPEMMDGKLKMGLMEGDLVSIKTYQNQQGRLTPVIFKQDRSSFLKIIKNNNYTSSLAKKI